MLFANIALLDHNLQPQSHRYVGVSGDTIDYISDAPPQQDYGEVYDGQNKLLLSAFYNAHGHTPMTLLRGYGENLNLQDWLHNRIFPFEALLTPEDIYWATLLGIAEMLQYGTASVTDMYFPGKAMAEAYRRAGMKCNLGIGTSAMNGEGLYDLPRYQEYQALFEEYHGSGNGRLRIDTCIHAEYTSNPKLVAQMAEYAKRKQARLQVHISETKLEHQECIARHGKTPIQYFNDLGVFENPTNAAHCVWVTPEDIQTLAAKQVTVATCPISNLKLASGICDVPALLAAGVNVALGTDSVASNNNLDMIEEMKVFAILHKGWQQDPTLLTPQDAINAATRAGALSQGRDDCGLLQTGYKADLTVLDLDRPNLQPCHDLRNNLVYAAGGSQICLTMVDGQVLYRDGQFPTLDIEQIYHQVDRSRQRILTTL